MRKIVAGFAASIDGYIEGPGGELDWIIIDEKMDFTEQLKRFDAFLFGRRSYEAALAMGTTFSEEAINYVFSTTLTSLLPGFQLISGNVNETVTALKQQPGKDMALYGGAGLLTSFLNLKLVDEITISFIPVLLGKGKSMVDLLNQKLWLKFLSSRRYENGTLVVNYAVTYNNHS